MAMTTHTSVSNFYRVQTERKMLSELGTRSQAPIQLSVRNNCPIDQASNNKWTGHLMMNKESSDNLGIK